jgi:hypothetical protein
MSHDDQRRRSSRNRMAFPTLFCSSDVFLIILNTTQCNNFWIRRRKQKIKPLFSFHVILTALRRNDGSFSAIYRRLNSALSPYFDPGNLGEQYGGVLWRSLV